MSKANQGGPAGRAERLTGSPVVGGALAALAERECENGIESIGETCSAVASDPDNEGEDDYRFQHWCGPCIAAALLAEGFDAASDESLAATLGPLTYLACPYSHPDRAVRVARFEAANEATAMLTREGHFVFSPISQSHPVAEAHALPTHWEFWAAFDRAFLSCCYRIVVLCLEGWELSTGVTAEIVIAQEMGIPVEYMDLASNASAAEPPAKDSQKDPQP